MKKKNIFLIGSFHCLNLILILLYLYPGSIFGYILYNDLSIQPKITNDFLISSNHFYVFIILSAIGVLAYWGNKKITFLIRYLIFLSVILELFHILIPNRSFELKDLFGNIIGVVVVVVIYKIKKKYD